MRKNNHSKQFVFIVCILILSINNCISQSDSIFPKRVLLTNDDGIDDPNIIELARAFSKVTETWVIAPGEIKGVKVAERAGILLNFNFKENITDTTYRKATWYLLRPNPIQSETKESDVNLYNSGYIVVAPMLADEHDYQLINYLKKNMNSMPKWETGN